MANFKHFYGEENKVLYEHKSNKKYSSMSFELKKWAYIFDAFSIMSGFLKEEKINVFNCCKTSYLDCFKRI